MNALELVSYSIAVIHSIVATIAFVLMVVVAVAFYKAPRSRREIVFSIVSYPRLRTMIYVLTIGYTFHLLSDVALPLETNSPIASTLVGALDLVFTSSFIIFAYLAYGLSKSIRKRTYIFEGMHSEERIPSRSDFLGEDSPSDGRMDGGNKRE